MDLAPGRGATREHSPQRSVTEEQRRPGAKDTPPVWVDAQTGQPLGATTEHIPQWICKGGATTRLAGLCVNPYGRSVFGSRPSLLLGHRALTAPSSRLGLEPNPSPRRC